MKKMNKWIAFGLLLVGLVLLNLIASLIPGQIDLTENNLYTISPGSRSLLSKLSEPVTLKFYFSRSMEGAPVMIKNYATRIEELLRQYRSVSKGKLTLEIIDPKPDTKEEESAIRSEISGQPSPTGETLFFGLVAIQADQEKSIPMFNIQREQFLEFDISQLIYQVQQLKLPKLGIISSLDMIGDNRPKMHQMMSQQQSQDWVFIQELRKNFEVVQIGEEEISEEIDVLAVIHPQGISEQLSYAIDQFLLAGKPVFMAVDPSSYVQKGRANPQQMMMGGMNPSSDMPQLFAKWGIEYSSTQVIGDLTYAASINTRRGGGAVRYPAWLAMNVFSAESPATAQLNRMMIPEAGSFKLKENPDLKLTSWITSSGQNSQLMTSMLMFPNPEQVIRDIHPDNQILTIAGMIQGKFPTAFPNGKPKPKEADKKSSPETEPSFKESKDTSTLILIADTDFLADQFSVQVVNYFGMKAVMPLNDNLAFVSNSIELLAGSQDLISLRSKGSSVRSFKRVEKMEMDAQKNYQEELVGLEGRLQKVQQDLRDLQSQQKDQGQLIASSEARHAIDKFRLEEAETRSKLREIKKKSREDTEALDRTLALFNLLTVPALVSAVGIQFFIKRGKRRKR